MRTAERYDILNMAKRRGQGVLVELDRSNEKSIRRLAWERDHRERREKVQREGDLFEYAREHPELCPPVGTVLQIVNKYGVRATLTVKMVLNGMPGTVFELLPLSQQPEHLRDEALLARHTKDCGCLGWVNWADVAAWKLWQQLTKQTSAGCQAQTAVPAGVGK